MTPQGFRSNKNNKSKKSAKTVFAIVISVVIFALLAVLFFVLGKSGATKANAENSVSADNQENDILQSVDDEDVSKLEMRGLWIASTINIDYPSKTGLSAKELKGEIDDILKNASELGINSVFFQVRPTADALYKSDIFPSSKYVSGAQGQTVENFDSLEYILESSKQYNIDIHAWVNPFRVTMYESDEAQLSSDNPAVLHPEYTIKYADGKTYFDPGNPNVRKLIVEGVREIATKYPDIAGIHYDDYFYPYPSGNAEFNDDSSYSLYGGGLDRADWRRNNVNTLVKDTYDAIKAIDEDISFGVSVFGIWANESSKNTYVPGSNTNGLEAYNSLYCDALSWARGGYVDYIAPQNYWSFDTKAAPFDEVARWWNSVLDGTETELYIGHAAYKSGDYTKNEIYKQVEFSRSLSTYKGSIFYGYENICENVGGVCDDIKRLYEHKKQKQALGDEQKPISISFPDNNSYVDSDYTYIIGSCSPAYPLYVNGKAVSKTTGGYFGLYVPVENGRNTFTFTQNGEQKVLTLNNGNKVHTPSASSQKTLDGMVIKSTYPERSVWLSEDEELYVSCVAPAGSVVKARLGDDEVTLKPTINPAGNGKYLYEKYTGTLKSTALVKETDIKLLGNVTFTAQMANELATAVGGEISVKGKNSYVYAEVKQDYTHTKVGTESSFYDDFLPSSKGMRDYVIDKVDGFCKMRFGGYIDEEKLMFTYGKPLLLNTILTTAIEVNVSDSTNNKNNSTDIRFGVTENIPVDVDFRGENGQMRIIIYNTDTSIIPQFEMVDNPLIKSIVGKKGTRENMLMYHVTFKDNTNFYGFNIVYENGAMIVKLNNPQTLASGDKPLLNKRVVVDAGHGGNDAGALGPGTQYEKILNQNIASHLAKKLRELGAEVVESRPGDETVDLYERMDILNNECPDFAISIHHNSIAGAANALKTRGFMALYSNNSGVSLSTTISDVVCRELVREQKPTAYQKLAVARNHRFPSTLLEMCFISNVEEYQWSINEGNAEKSAKAIVDGVLEYYKNQEKYLDY